MNLQAVQAKNALQYKVNEVFYSLQGEGARAGEPSLFLRFSDCNLRCTQESAGFDCDTEFVSGRVMELEEIISTLKSHSTSSEWVVLTGGEPSLQINDALIDSLHSQNWKIAIETNGLRKISDKIDWVSVSPKTAEHTIKQKKASEVKYVRAFGMGIPQTQVKAEHYFISPRFDANTLSRQDLDWCIELCKNNPPWKLSLQQHKLWNIR